MASTAGRVAAFQEPRDRAARVDRPSLATALYRCVWSRRRPSCAHAMETTLVAVEGKGTNPKTTLYVGGVEESVTESTLHAAFIPFGDIKDVNMPMDHASGKHRGFGFVEFEEREDAAAAIDNMHNAELFGRVLKVNYAQPMKIKGGDKGWSHQPVWADADKYLEEAEAEQELEEIDQMQKKAAKESNKEDAAMIPA